jgi:hypothetical protein
MAVGDCLSWPEEADRFYARCLEVNTVEIIVDEHHSHLMVMIEFTEKY